MDLEANKHMNGGQPVASTMDRLAKEITAMRVVLAFIVAIFTAGMVFSSVWALPAKVKTLETRTEDLEQHHSADHVRLENISRSQDWQQNTLWKLSQRMRVPDVEPTPAPAPIPTVHLTPVQVP